MRRIVSITLLLLVSLPLISPLFAAGRADGSLPACCRRDGKHHCMMLNMDQSLAIDGKAHRFIAMGERCPLYPATVQTAGLRLLSPPCRQAAVITPDNNIALRVTQAEALFRVSFDRSRQKRGPPCESPSLS